MDPLDTLRDILSRAFGSWATDIFLMAGEPPRGRIEHEVIDLATVPITPDMLQALANACGAPTDSPSDFDTSWVVRAGLRCRVNLYRSLGRPAAVLRPIRAEIPPMDILGLPAHLLEAWMTRRNGLVLITGPTGSGKSTTVAACLEWLNQNMARHIVTLEDPIEYLFTPARCHISQREIGHDSPDFASALRAVLRQSPDVIFLGEIRDAETAVTALQAAETGHLVISTLHCSSVVETLDRFSHLLADQGGLATHLLANQLIGILTQQLLPRPDGTLFAALEYTQNEAATRKWILEHRHNDLLDHMHRGDGTTSVSLLTTLVHATQNGWLDSETARAACPRPADFDRALRGIAHG